ncbi:hypothetical protein AB0K68_42015 [Streptomyces sp. NPDC050698]
MTRSVSIGCPSTVSRGRGRVDVVVLEVALDAVGVRVPALAEQQLQLTLGHSAPSVSPSARRPRPSHRPGGSPASSWASFNDCPAGRRPSPNATPRMQYRHALRLWMLATLSIAPAHTGSDQQESVIPPGGRLHWNFTADPV